MSKGVWRRDNKDISLLNTLIQKEFERVKKKYNREHALHHMRIFKQGVWEARNELVKLIKSEMTAENEKYDMDPDHWFEINTANCALFPDLVLDGIDELLPGRLFTTRMPRNIKDNPESAEKFKEKREFFNPHTALILTEHEEYEKYAGADLEEFYKSLSLNVIHRPIKDFSVPVQQDIVQDVKDITWLLAEGKNVLVHCAGGTGRTGMVIASVIKNVGVHNPIAWIRRVKSSYVETLEQEQFVNGLPSVIDERIAEKHPLLAEALVTERLLATEHFLTSSPKSNGNDDSSKIPETLEELGLTPEQLDDFSLLFDIIDKDKNGTLSSGELEQEFLRFGVKDPQSIWKAVKVDTESPVSKFDFLKAMAHTVKSHQ